MKMDTKNFAIGVLSTTATILLVGLIVLHTRPAPLLASGMTTAGGSYVMTVGSDMTGDQELVYITDNSSSKIAVYSFDSRQRSIQILQGIEMDKLRASAGGRTKQPARGVPNRGRRRRP